MSNKIRPLSPHLQVYKPQLTSVLSISHRFTGMVLFLGTILFSLITFTAITYPTFWDSVYTKTPQWLGYLIFFVISASLIYHWLNGIRHLLWDNLIGLELKSVYRSGYAVIVAFIIILSIIWLVIFIR